LPTEFTDIQIHDTYFVLTYWHTAIIFSILLGGIGLLYWLFSRKQLIKWMTIFHTLITILPMLILFIWIGFPNLKEHIHYIEGDAFVRPIFYFLLLFLLGQILFVLNLLITLFKPAE